MYTNEPTPDDDGWWQMQDVDEEWIREWNEWMDAKERKAGIQYAVDATRDAGLEVHYCTRCHEPCTVENGLSACCFADYADEPDLDEDWITYGDGPRNDYTD